MKPIPLKNPDVRFLPPEGWDAEIQGECGILDAYKEPSLGHFTTFWRPEPEELAALNRGAPICLRVVSRVHPPVSVGVLELEDENKRLREGLDYYAKDHPFPNDGPWGVNSDDFGNVARAALTSKGEG